MKSSLLTGTNPGDASIFSTETTTIYRKARKQVETAE